MSALTHDDLVAIERHAELAPVQQLRLQAMRIRDELRHLVADDADYARALLLKLGRIVDEQLTPRADARGISPRSADWGLPQPIQVPAWASTLSSAPTARKRVPRRTRPSASQPLQ